MSEIRQEQSKRIAPRTAFKPGQSGNPGGRPAALRGIQELARQHTSEAVDALRAALKRPRERVRAAELLLAYAYGRPTQQVNLGGGLTLEQLVLESMAPRPPTIECAAEPADETNRGHPSLPPPGYSPER
jgi:Family of unknown function (DUF5681)